MFIFFYLPVCFLKREKEGMELDGWGGKENLGGDEGGETIYFMKAMN